MSLSARAVTALAGVAVAAVAATCTVGIVTSHHTLTVSADNLDRIVSGFYPDVGSALDAAGVTLGEHDTVVPSLESSLHRVPVIEVRRARPFAVHTEEGVKTAWSAAGSVEDVFVDVGGQARKITASRGLGRDSIPVTELPGQVSVTVDGDVQQIQVSGGETLEEVLDSAHIDPGPLDSVFVVSDAGQVGIDVTTEQREVVVTKEKIPHETEYVEDPEELEGTETVTQEGRDGRRNIRTYRQIIGGEVVQTTVLSDRVSRKPVTEIVSKGTKEPEPERASASSSDVSGVTITEEDTWAALAECESGGNPSANTGNGYYGMYQFSLPTWQSVGGAGLPSDASAQEQTKRAQILQQRSGWGQWPACSARLGLR